MREDALGFHIGNRLHKVADPNASKGSNFPLPQTMGTFAEDIHNFAAVADFDFFNKMHFSFSFSLGGYIIS
jgi:hypothetical protein